MYLYLSSLPRIPLKNEVQKTLGKKYVVYKYNAPEQLKNSPPSQAAMHLCESITPIHFIKQKCAFLIYMKHVIFTFVVSF